MCMCGGRRAPGYVPAPRVSFPTNPLPGSSNLVAKFNDREESHSDCSLSNPTCLSIYFHW